MNLEKTIQELQEVEKKIALAKAERGQLFRAIGLELRQMRKDRNLKGVTIAKAARITQPHLFFVEHGEARLDAALLKKVHGAIVKMGGK